MRYFSKQTFSFLEALAENNDREWFALHKQEYEDLVRTPALDLIRDVAEDLPSVSPHVRALPKRVGGSLMRIHRDIRFGKDKTPYKINIGIQFRHEAGKDIHAPGFYVHLAPAECFVGAGLWRPDSGTLFKLREAIVNESEAWLAARDDKLFREHFTLQGDALAGTPRGFSSDHPLLEDLKRKDFIGLTGLPENSVTSAGLRPLLVDRFGRAAPFMKFLCNALALRF
jgi:uncharacterized protein (TIGR02453 family)